LQVRVLLGELKVREVIETMIEAGPGPVPRGRLPRTPSLEHALEVARAEASPVGGKENTVALLLSLASEERGVVSRALSTLGVQQEVMRVGTAEQPGVN
jgi:hypothetical protein